VGSRSKIDLAYIAGFLDGDGSVMLQVKKRKDGRLKARFMATICFYQDTRHEKTLYWIRNILAIGYITRRNDGMTELRINGYQQVKDILRALLPYIRFKKAQVRSLLLACEILCQETLRTLDQNKLKRLVGCMLIIQDANYVTRKKKTKEEYYKIFGLTP
jgi:hypothetical protein